MFVFFVCVCVCVCLFWLFCFSFLPFFFHSFLTHRFVQSVPYDPNLKLLNILNLNFIYQVATADFFTNAGLKKKNNLNKNINAHT